MKLHRLDTPCTRRGEDAVLDGERPTDEGEPRDRHRGSGPAPTRAEAGEDDGDVERLGADPDDPESRRLNSRVGDPQVADDQGSWAESEVDAIHRQQRPTVVIDHAKAAQAEPSLEYLELQGVERHLPARQLGELGDHQPADNTGKSDQCDGDQCDEHGGGDGSVAEHSAAHDAFIITSDERSYCAAGTSRSLSPLGQTTFTTMWRVTVTMTYPPGG